MVDKAWSPDVEPCTGQAAPTGQVRAVPSSSSVSPTWTFLIFLTFIYLPVPSVVPVSPSQLCCSFTFLSFPLSPDRGWGWATENLARGVPGKKCRSRGKGCPSPKTSPGRSWRFLQHLPAFLFLSSSLTLFPVLQFMAK